MLDLSKLNKDQKEAVINFEGPSFIIAGPGAGKTRVIIFRAAYMIKSGINPKNILLFTFTRKAAKEIKERIEKEIGLDAKGITTGTYHNFCSRLLRKYAEYIGFNPRFSIYDSDDKLKLLKKLCEKESTQIRYKKLAEFISGFKKQMLFPEQAIENYTTFPMGEAAYL